MNHCIEITLSSRKYVMAYHGDSIGDFKSPETEAARWLLANGHAAYDDTLTICRNGSPAMSGSICWLAGRTVIENEKESPRFAKWRPFAMAPSDGSATPCGNAQEPQD